MSTEEEIRNTTFFFGMSIPESVKRHFPRHYTLDEEKENHYIKNKYVRSLAMKIMRRRWYPELYGSEIYGLDFHYSLLRGFRINYIEDAPCVLDVFENTHLYECYKRFMAQPAFVRWCKRLLFGDYYQCPVGTSPLVKCIYTSTPPAHKEYHEGKEQRQVDLEKSWRESPETKKEFILRVFGLDGSQLEALCRRDTILLTQPFAVDRKMTEAEQIGMYREIVGHYGEENVVVKPHPRDRCDYRKEFPGALVFDKPVPMQFLVMLGCGKFSHIATVNSSSALSFGADAPIDWWGERMDEKVIRDNGFLTLAEAKASLGRNGKE